VSSNDLPVAAATRLVHIGPPTTSASALQSAPHEARARLAQQSVLHPGTGRPPMAAVHAVTEGHAKPNLSAWTRLADESPARMTVVRW
jgi:hypothetical protein